MEFPTICSRCGLSLAADNNPPLSTTPPDITDELTLIQDKLRQLEDTIHHLNTHKVTLLRKLNELQPAPRKLPSEILSNIFHYASPPDPLNSLASPQASRVEKQFDGPYFPLVLSAVSSHWREVAQSTPQLWTNIAVEVHSSSVPKTVMLLQHCLQFSKMLPVSLGVDFRECNAETDHEEPRSDELAGLDGYLNPVAHTIFFGYSSRIKRLYLGDPPPGWLPFIRGDFAQLEDLHLDFTRHQRSLSWLWGLTPPSSVTFAKIPSLRRLALHSVNVGLKALGSTLTALYIHLLSPHDAIKHLLSCPHIEEFHFRDPVNTDPWSVGDIPGRVVTLSHLRVFGWPLTATIGQGALFPTDLDLPAFEKLCIYIDGLVGPLDNSSNPFARFLSRVSSTLSTLELVDHGSFAFVSSLPGIFSEIHPCKLNIIGGQNPGFVLQVIHALTPSPSDPHAKHLPSLRELYIKDANVSSGIFNQKHPNLHTYFEGNLVCDLVQMIRKRWEGNCAPLCLELSNICIDWTTEAKQELSAMIRAGLELEIISDLRPVEWLNATP